MPTIMLMKVQTKPMMIEFLAPAQTTSKTSLPRLSVPKMCSLQGLMKRMDSSLTFGAISGSYPEMIGWIIAKPIIISITIATPTMNLLLKKVCHTDFQ